MTFSHPQYSCFETAPYEEGVGNKFVRRSLVGGAAPVQDASLLEPPDDYDALFAMEWSQAKSLLEVIGSQDTIAATSDPGCVSGPDFYLYKLSRNVYYVDSLTKERVEPDYEWGHTTSNPLLIDGIGGDSADKSSSLWNFVQNGSDPFDPDKICPDPPASQCCTQEITGNSIVCELSYTDSAGVSDSFTVTLSDIKSTQFGNRN
jgi:hypothetical protein